MKGKRRLISKPLLSLGSLLLCLVVVELGMRAVERLRENERLQEGQQASTAAGTNLRRIHDYIYYDRNGTVRRVPSVQGLHRNYDNPGKGMLIRINAEGIRGEELLQEPAKRVLFIGDSVVFGGGVPLQTTFVYQLELLLNGGRAKQERQGVEVLNFATADAGIDQYEKKLRFHGIGLKPDQVFIGLYLNDAVSPQGYLGAENLDGFERFMESDLVSGIRIADLFNRAYRNIKYTQKRDLKERFRWVPRYQRRAYLHDRQEFVALVEEADLDWGAAWRPKRWEKIRFYLARIAELCESHGIQLVVFQFPVEPQIVSAVEWEHMTYPQEQLSRTCNDLGITCFDLLPALRKHRQKPILNDQCHYNTLGQGILAEILFDIIQQNPSVFGSYPTDRLPHQP